MYTLPPHTSQDHTNQVFNVTNIGGTVHLRCADRLAVGLVLACDKLNKKTPLVSDLSLSRLIGQVCLQLTGRPQVAVLPNQ